MAPAIQITTTTEIKAINIDNSFVLQNAIAKIIDENSKSGINTNSMRWDIIRHLEQNYFMYKKPENLL